MEVLLKGRKEDTVKTCTLISETRSALGYERSHGKRKGYVAKINVVAVVFISVN